MARNGRAADIYLLGRGIAGGVAQMSVEALEAIKRSRLVFDLSGDVKAIRKLHSNVVDLYDDYWTGELCDDVYARLEEQVLAEVTENGPTVSIIVDGHPLLFDDVNWSIVRRGKRKGLKVVPLPGISCLDTMMIDVGVDMAEGAQIVHANQLLLYEIRLDPHMQTYVFQVGKFGTDFFSRETKRNLPKRFTPLVEYLTRFYPADHVVTLIVSTGNGEGTFRKRIRLAKLDDARAFLHKYQDYGLSMHIPACPREITNEAFSRQIDDLEHLARIAVLAEE